MPRWAKSLLRRTPNGRYETHELLRQYGAARLHEIAEDEQQTRARHAAWYAEFLVQCASRLKGRHQQAALREIIDEMENIRVAWDWMAEQCELALLARSFQGLWLFFARHGSTIEAGSLFEQTIPRLERLNGLDAARLNEHDRLLGRLYSGLGAMHYRLGNFARARSLLEQGITMLRRLDAQPDLAFALHHLAAMLHLHGAYREEQALLHESIALSEAEGDHWLTGYSRNDLGLCTYMLGDDHAARRFCTDSFAIFKAIDDRRGMAFALNNLGVIAAARGEYREAERLHRESLALRRDIDDRWGIAMSLFQLGIVLRPAGQFDDSRARLLDALRAAYEIRALPLALDILVELAHVLVIAGEDEQARTLLGAAMQHAALTVETRHKAEQIVTDASTLIDTYGLDQATSTSIDSLITTQLNPRLSQHRNRSNMPYVFLTDFIGWLPIDRSVRSREASLTADYNAEMIKQVQRYKRIRDRALYIGDYDDLVPERFGPDLPFIPDWTREHFTAVGYVVPFDPSDYTDTRALRTRLGYDPEHPLVICAVGGTTIGQPLLRKAIAAWPLIRREHPEAQCVVVAGPRIDPQSLPQHAGLTIQPYVHNLYEHLAAADLGIAQGGLSTTMELTVNRRPFVYFPIKDHCEQVYNVAYRLDHYRAGRRLDLATTNVPHLSEVALETLAGDTSGYREHAPSGASRAATLIAESL